MLLTIGTTSLECAPGLDFILAEVDLIRMVGDEDVEAGDGLLQVFGRDLHTLGAADLFVFGVSVLEDE